MAFWFLGDYNEMHYETMNLTPNSEPWILKLSIKSTSIDLGIEMKSFIGLGSTQTFPFSSLVRFASTFDLGTSFHYQTEGLGSNDEELLV